MIPGIVAGSLAVPAEWATTYTAGAGANSAIWDGYTLRQPIPASALASGSSIRLTFAAATSGSNLVIAKAFIQAAGADPYDFNAAPVQMLFSGGPGATIAVGATATTDEAVIPIPAATSLVVSIFITSGDLYRFTEGGWSGYYKPGDDAINQDVSGYSSSAGYNYAVQKVEVR